MPEETATWIIATTLTCMIILIIVNCVTAHMNEKWKQRDLDRLKRDRLRQWRGEE